MNKWRYELENIGVFFENYRSGQVRSVKVWYDDNDINDDKLISHKFDVTVVTDVTEPKQDAFIADLCGYSAKDEKVPTEGKNRNLGDLWAKVI